MASSFSEGERVRLFTLSLPESFQFFSVGACSHWLVLLDGSTGDVFASGLSWSPMSDMGSFATFWPWTSHFWSTPMSRRSQGKSACLKRAKATRLGLNRNKAPIGAALAVQI